MEMVTLTVKAYGRACIRGHYAVVSPVAVGYVTNGGIQISVLADTVIGMGIPTFGRG